MVERLLPIADLFGWVPEFLDWLGGALSWLVEQPEWAWDELSATTRAAIVLAALAIALGFAIRKLRLRWLARSPRVQITEFTWTGAEEKGRDGLWATSLFREQLSLLQTDPLDPLPERSPSAPLVDIVEGVSQGVTQKADFGKMAGRLFRAIWPAAAYEVWGTLRPLKSGEDRVSVQLVDRARGNQTLVSDAFADDNWRRGARRAAMAVAGGLYPKIAKKRRGPWTGWRDAVPERLLSHYHDAQEHETKNELAQAMGAYHRALREDPLNPELRLKIAMLQERLALDLDAWVTYLAIVDEIDRRAWKGPERQTRFIALYRLAILLGNDRLAKQWMETAAEPGRPTMRDTERARRRAELRTALESDRMLTGGSPLGRPDAPRVSSASAARLLDPMLPGRAARRGWVQETFPLLEEENGTATERCRLIRRACGAAGESRGSEAQERRIGEVLKLLSLRRLEDLDAWLSVLPPLRPRQWGSWRLCRPPLRQWLTRRILSRSVVRVSKRLARIQIAADVEGRATTGAAVAKVRKEHRALTRAWPFPLPESAFVRRHARWLSVRRWWANRRGDSWQLHYNAACAVAAVLRPDSVWHNSGEADGAAFEEGIERHDIVEAAIDQLEQYAHRAGSDKVAAQADWVAFDDPDLDGLHKAAAFKRWASHHIPRDLAKERPKRRIDIEHYTARVLHDAARTFAKTWIERATGEEADPGVVAAWWRTEADAWKRVAGACREHRSWHYRLEALEALKHWLETHQKLDRVEFGHAGRDEMVNAPEVTDGLFDEIAVLVGADACPRPARATALRWAHSRKIAAGALAENEARSLAHRSIRNGARRDALKAARLWNRLADVLRDELDRSPAAGDDGHPWTFLRPVRRELPLSPRWSLRSAKVHARVLRRRIADKL